MNVGSWLSRRSVRLTLAGLLGAAVLAAGWLWYTGRLGPATAGRGGRRSATVAVETTAVQRTTVRDVRTFTGTLNPRAAFDVAPKIAGRLESLPVDIGDEVTKGQVVARLDDDELVQQVQQAQAELGVAKAALQEARGLLQVRENQLRRSRELFKKGIGSEAGLESAEADVISQQGKVQVAQAQVTQRQAALRAAQVRLSYTVIRVGWSGDGERRVIGERYVNEGEMLPANKALFSVLDIDALTAVVFATEADYALLEPGQAVTVIADALPDRRFPGRIARLAPQFQQESRQARMEITVPNPERLLKPGMYVRVEVEVSRIDDAAVVPQESVVNRSGHRGVFVVQGDPPAAHFIPVRTGLVHGDRVQVTEPALTQPVVSLGQHLLQEGTRVRLAHRPDAAPAGDGTAPPARGRAP